MAETTIGTPYPDLVADLLAYLLADEVVGVKTAIPGPDLPWLPWYAADFYGDPDVEAMDDRRQNWYRRLLDKSWQQKTPCFLPYDMVKLAAYCRCTPLELKADGQIVLDKFKPTEDGAFLYNRRMLKEYLAKAIPYSKQVSAGRGHGKGRGQASPLPNRLASPLPTPQGEGIPTPNQNQNQKNLKPEREITPDESLSGRDDLEEKLFALVKALPKGGKFASMTRVPHEVLEAIWQAIRDEALSKQTTELEAYVHILRRTAIYAGYVCQWDKSEARFSSNPVEWFGGSHYNDHESTWERITDGKATGPVAVTTGNRIPAGIARTRNNHSAALAAIQFDRETRSDHRSDDAPSGNDESNA